MRWCSIACFLIWEGRLFKFLQTESGSPWIQQKLHILIKRCGGTGPMKHSNRNNKIQGAKSCKPKGLIDKKVIIVINLLSYLSESRFFIL
jgi:hypothetical protein